MSINSGNVFSAKNLSEYMYTSLLKEPTPELRNPYDAVALLSHACMLAVGFRLLGLGEHHKIGVFMISELQTAGFLTSSQKLPLILGVHSLYLENGTLQPLAIMHFDTHIPNLH